MPLILVGLFVVIFLFVKLGFWISFGIILVGVIVGMFAFMPRDVMQMFGPIYFYVLIILAVVIAGSYFLTTHISFNF